MAKAAKKITGKKDAETASTKFHNIMRATDNDVPDLPKLKKAIPVNAKKAAKKAK